MDDSVSRFWDRYIFKTKSYVKNDTAARWYVRHAEQYIKAHPEHRLSTHTMEMLTAYLKDKGRNPHLKDWQFKQIVYALKILFKEVLSSSWATDFPWEDWVDAATQLNADHPTLARDSSQGGIPNKEEFALDSYRDLPQGLLKKVYEKHPKQINYFIHRLRIRHYSIRTEQTYQGI